MTSTVTSNTTTIYPQIIISADDYGYSWERCQGIMQLIQNRCISSTNVIINAVQIQDKCKKLLKFCSNDKGDVGEAGVLSSRLLAEQIDMENRNTWQLSIGLHLNFTEFRSCQINQASLETSLIDPQTNTFKGKSFIYSNLGQIKNNSQFIENQIRAQIQKFIEIFNFRPSHIDGHNHINLIPEFATSICKIARLFGIYKVRLPIVPHLHQTQDQNVNIYNVKFLQMASEARKIYDSYGFLYPNYFMGLDMMGKQLTVDNFDFRLKQITETIPNSALNSTVVEIMTHPGYRQQKEFAQYKTCLFSMSQQRQFEIKTLKSKQFSKFKPYIVSFKNLTKQKPEKSILIYSKLVKCCGNLTTSLRLYQIFTDLKYRVYFLDVSESGEDEEAKYLAQMVDQLCINFVLGVNLTRTAGIIHKALNGTKREISYKVPYGLVVAGTDANVTLDSGLKEVLQSIKLSVNQAECLVSISQKMKTKIDSYLSENNVTKQAILIRQSTINASAYKKINNVNISNLTGSKPYIVFPTSFRKVKAVHHILPELNLLIDKHNINVYVLGPIIDDKYYKETIKKFNKVIYLDCQPHEIYLQILKNAMLLINCSESQGMSCSILEAFGQKVPVIARKNQGNCQLVIDGVNGFLYEKGEDFIQKFQKLLSNYEPTRKKICAKAYSMLHQSFSYESESQSYKKLLNNHLQSYFYQLKISSKIQQNQNEMVSLNLLSLNNVHAVSPVNLKIFNKFFEKADSGVNPCFEYIGKILGNSGQEQKCINFLDVGCGNGIFTLYFLIKFMVFFGDSQEKIKINLTFVDIHQDSLRNLKVNLRAFQQVYNSWKDHKLVLGTITILQSNMFEQLRIRNLGNFDIILANMPQTPFKNEKSRLDKNGGSDGFKLTTILLQNYRKYLKNQNSILIILYSHMLNESKFKQILHNNSSKIEWISQPQIHKIKREDYDKMQERLAFMIEENMKNGKSGIKLQGEVFLVPADLRIIKPQ